VDSNKKVAYIDGRHGGKRGSEKGVARTGIRAGGERG
jgi:hypothetical protein